MILPTVMRGLRLRVRVLEDHLHPAAQLPQLARRRALVRSWPSNVIEPAGGLVQPDDRPAGRALAAAGLADEAERLAAPERRTMTPSTARTSPTWRWRIIPSVIGKQTLRSSTASSGVPSASRRGRRGDVGVGSGRRAGSLRRRSPSAIAAWRRRARRAAPAGRRPPARRAGAQSGGPADGLVGRSAGCGTRSRWVAPGPVVTTAVPGVDGRERRVLGPAARRAATRSAARTGSPWARCACPAAGPRSGSAARPRGRRRAGSSAAGPTVYGCDGRSNRSPRRRRLDDEAGVHHVDPVGHPGDDAEVVGDQDERRPGLGRSAGAMSSRTWAWIVTSSAVVGSSAISSFGSSASAMAIITRWRMPPENWCGKLLRRVSGLRDADHRRAARSARARASASVDLPVGPDRLDHLLLDREHRVEARHRVLEDHRDVAAADLAHVGLVQRDAGPAPSNRTWPPSIRPAGLGSSRMIARLVTLLPQPDSPTRPRRSPSAELERDAVDGVDRPVVGPEPDDQVLDREQRSRSASGASARRHRFSRGSSDSRRPSPSRLKPIALMTIASAREEHAATAPGGGTPWRR